MESTVQITEGLTTTCYSCILPHLQSLEDKDRKHVHQKDSLNREQRYLLRRLDQLRNSVPMNKRRSVSECSISTVSSTNSTAGSPSSLCEFMPGEDHFYVLLEHGTTCIHVTQSLLIELIGLIIMSLFYFLLPDEVDVIGFTSNQSDTDDHSSVQSLQSGSTDSGVVMSRLTLCDNSEPK